MTREERIAGILVVAPGLNIERMRALSEHDIIALQYAVRSRAPDQELIDELMEDDEGEEES